MTRCSSWPTWAIWSWEVGASPSTQLSSVGLHHIPSPSRSELTYIADPMQLVDELSMIYTTCL